MVNANTTNPSREDLKTLVFEARRFLKRAATNDHKKITWLSYEITRLNKMYYAGDDEFGSGISDYEFDMMYKELEKLEKNNPHLINSDSPTQKVGN